ncbi:hypothetical protein ACFL5Q_03165 [Planctomycetota bacterium]
MPLNEYHTTFTATRFRKVVLILDASESARASQPRIASLVDQVLTLLPAGTRPALYFLGNPSPYSVHLFSAHAASLFEKNRSRASLITPIWETLAEDDNAEVVVIGSGRIFDLEDWQGSRLLEHTLLVNMGEMFQADCRLAEEIESPSAEQLVNRLHDPVVQVRISGPGFMPTSCTNAGYRLHIVENRVSLLGDRLADSSVRLRFLGIDLATIEVVATRASERQTVERLSAIPPDSSFIGSTGELAETERTVFRHALRGEDFDCPLCDKQHSWATLRCREGAVILGELIYPSLQAHNASGFVVFIATEDSVCYEVHPFDVLHLGPDRVAVREGAGAAIYWFDERGERWAPSGEMLQPYGALERNKYAILV